MTTNSQAVGTELQFAIDRFTREVEGIASVLPEVCTAADRSERKSSSQLEELIRSRCQSGDHFSIPVDVYWEFVRLQRRVDRTTSAKELLPRMLLVGLISQFDALSGSLVRAICLARPHIIEKSQREIKAEQLFGFTDLAEARSWLVDREVEQFLRDSHSRQFSYLAKHSQVSSLIDDLESWPQFVEITQRRHLCVHCNGVVSQQYLDVCTRAGSDISSAKPGHAVRVDFSYVASAAEVVHEIGVKLGYILWRKLAPDKREDADLHIQMHVYHLIAEGRHELALNLGLFAHDSFRSGTTERIRLLNLLNVAQAYKWLGRVEDCSQELAVIDWTTKSEELRAGWLALTDDVEGVISIMQKMGTDGPIRSGDWMNWPIFREVRQSEGFEEAYQAVFGSTVPDPRQPVPTASEDNTLRAEIQTGIDELDRGEGIPANEVFSELRSRIGENSGEQA